MTTQAATPTTVIPTSCTVVPLPQEHQWATEIDAGCNQDYQVRLRDDWHLIIVTDHGNLISWELLTPTGVQPKQGPLTGRFAFGRFELPAVTELAAAVSGAELAAGHGQSKTFLDQWTQDHSWETDEEERTGYETPSAEAHTLQEDVCRVVTNFSLDCQDVTVHMRSELFEHLRDAFRDRDGRHLLPFAHVEVIELDDLGAWVHPKAFGDQAVMSFEVTDAEAATLLKECVAAVHQNGRIYLALAF